MYMTSYSLFFIDSNDRIERSHQVDCLSDEQAVEMARQETGDHCAVQVWAADRSVAMVGNSHEATSFGNLLSSAQSPPA